MRKTHIDATMTRSFINEPCYVAKSRKKYSTSRFLLCSSDGTSSDNNSFTKCLSKTDNRTTRCTIKSDRSLDFVSSRPPSNPKDNSNPRKCSSTSNETRSHIPVRSACCLFNNKSKTDLHNKYSQSELPAPPHKNGYTKSTSFQALSFDEHGAKSTNIYPHNGLDTSINRGYYSLQRPRCFSAFNGTTFLALEPSNLRPLRHRRRRSTRTSMANQRRREYSLNLTIESISNVTSKKRYHCELILNGRTYARTSSKVAHKGEASWSDVYELCNLDPVTSITINLYKELIEGKGNKKRNVRHKIAFLTMDVEELYEKHEVKKKVLMCKWTDEPPELHDGVNLCLASEETVACGKIRYNNYGSNPDLTGQDYQSSSLPRDSCAGSTRATGLIRRYLKSKKDLSDSPVMSISAKYKCIEILPLSCYDQLRQFILNGHECLVNYLDDKLTGKKLEEIASSMVSIHEIADNTPMFIANAISSKIHTNNQSIPIVLRANTIGSKAIESYMKLTGMDYLRSILEDFSVKVLLYPSSLEVDPDRLDDTSLLKLTQVQLCSMVQSLCQKIYSSVPIFPMELKRVFVELRRSLDVRDLGELADQLLSSCLFLRFICPAILNPYLYQLINEYPQDPRIIRNFTLISKSLQTLANQSGPINEGPSLKEPFMIPIHEYLCKDRNRMISFLRQISIETAPCSSSSHGENPCQQYIDIGYELALSHLYFSDVFVSGEIDQNLPTNLCPLIPILDTISISLCTSTEDSSTKLMAQMLSKSCKLLADNVDEEFTTETSKLTGSYSSDMSHSEKNQNIRGNSLRKVSAPIDLGQVMDIRREKQSAHNRYTINVVQLDNLWKDLVNRAERHMNNVSKNGDISDRDCYLHDINSLGLDMSSLSTSDRTPTSHNHTTDTSINNDSNSSLNLYCVSRPTNLPSPLKSSPTKSIRMGTKVVQTFIQHKKPQSDMEAMRRIVSETESKYLLAMKQIHDKEEENRVLRELLRQQTDM